ncbi:MAG TPA: DNA repair protein RecO [Thermoanaerobaculia bacterium]|nr:DNA repair protein RecO [Thermoanaerobaculia bacterium]
MTLITAEALLLDVMDLHDRDRIVTFLTRELGKKKGVAKGARTKHSRFGGQLQPLAKVQVTWFEKEGRDLGRISSVELLRPAHRLLEDLDGILLGSYLADHLLEFAQENEASDHLYRLLDSTLEALLAGVDRDLAARYFESWVLRLAGVFPSPRACPACGRPFEEAGGAGAVLPPNDETLLCFDCGGRAGLVVTHETLDFLRRIGRESLPAVAAEGSGALPSVATLRQVETLCVRVRRQFLQRELRSYDVIQKTRAGI